MTAERDAAAAMVEAVALIYSDTLPVQRRSVDRASSERMAVLLLRAGLRALATHQHRTPSLLPVQSLVAWLRTVASEMGAGARADAAQDGAGTALGGAEVVGSGVAPDAAAAGAGGAVGPFYAGEPPARPAPDQVRAFVELFDRLGTFASSHHLVLGHGPLRHHELANGLDPTAGPVLAWLRGQGS